ncbi:MAG: type II toxin-antitoxin system RelE/ParE family toxin [Verrucomicrobiota bacterium]|nr:type II toxin-antitoxin system RelE/ParE family toxin [Verrucomicrobiota bacterium]
MGFKIIWTEKSAEDIASIVRFISRHNPRAGIEVGFGIYERVQILIEFPESGSEVPELNDSTWRQLLYRNYKIVYHLNRSSKTIEVVRVWHAARGEVEI